MEFRCLCILPTPLRADKIGPPVVCNSFPTAASSIMISPSTLRKWLLVGIASTIIVLTFSRLNEDRISELEIWELRAVDIGTLLDPSQTEVLAEPEFDANSIATVCNGRDWKAGLVFTCDGSHGGVVEIRNSILHCVRYAIDAGASLVVPRFVLTDCSGLAMDRTINYTGMDYLFDTDHFVHALAYACPQLSIFRTIEEIPNYENARPAVTFQPSNLLNHIPEFTVPPPDIWYDRFMQWLSKRPLPTVEIPVVIKLERSYLQYAVSSDDVIFVNNFGYILRFRNDIEHLATAILLKLMRRHKVVIDSQNPTSDKGFIGVRLEEDDFHETSSKLMTSKISSDALSDPLSMVALEHVSRTNTNIVYVSTRHLDQKISFENIARLNQSRLRVRSKFDLLFGHNQAELHALSWIQQEVVDFLVLEKSSCFVGTHGSSLSWNLALRRHLLDNVDGRNTEVVGVQAYEDAHSVLIGSDGEARRFRHGMWP